MQPSRCHRHQEGQLGPGTAAGPGGGAGWAEDVGRGVIILSSLQSVTLTPGQQSPVCVQGLGLARYCGLSSLRF